MTPEQKRAMEHYSPRVKGPGDKTLKYDRTDEQLRREQRLKNYTQSLFNKRASATGRNQLYAQSASSGQAATQLAALTMLSRDYQLNKAVVRNQFLGADVRSGAFARNAVLMGGQDRQKQLLESRGRNMAAQQDLETGATVKHAEALSKLDRQLASIQSRGKIQILSSDLKSGAFLKNAQEVAQLSKELRDLENQARMQTLVAEHGQFGAVLRANDRELKFLSGTAIGAFNSVKNFGMGLMHAGLAGTAEGYSLSLAWQRVAQQVAGIAVPAINSVARAIGGVAQWFRMLNGDQQKWILGFGLAALAIGPVVRMATTLFSVMTAIGRIGGVAAGMMGLGGLGGRLLGGAALGAGSSAASSAMITGMSASAAAEGGMLTAGAAGAVGASRFGALGRIARFGLTRVLPVAALADLAYGTFKTDESGKSYYNIERAAGHSKFASAVLGVGHRLREWGSTIGGLFGLDMSGEKYRRSILGSGPTVREPERRPAERTDVHPMTMEVLEGGESARRVQHAVLMHGAGSGAGETDATMDDLIKFLRGGFDMIADRLSLPRLPADR